MDFRWMEVYTKAGKFSAKIPPGEYLPILYFRPTGKPQLVKIKV